MKRWCLPAVALLLSLCVGHALAARVTFVHFNDIYEIQASEGGKQGGPARLATEVARLRKSAAPVIVTLGGDYLSPSALGTARIDGEALAGRQMVDVLNAIGVDWATFGNHEFDVSEVAFRRHLEQAKFKLVSSNVVGADGKPFPKAATSAIVQVKDGKRRLRIGLIGVTIDSTQTPWVRYRDPVDAAREEIARLKGKVDAIVALTHLTFAQDAEFLTALPEIDLVLGGHEHENWLLRRGPRLAPIVKADANARSLAVVTLQFGKPGTRPVADVKLISLDEHIRPDPATLALTNRWTEVAFSAFRREGFAPESVVTTTREPLDGRESVVRNRAGRLTDLIAAAMAREAGPVDVALFSGGSIRIDDVLPAGPVTEYDIIRVLPFGGKVVSASMEGPLLARILDIGQSNRGLGGYLQTWGVERKEGGWYIGGKALDASARYRVALSDFLLTGREVNLGLLTRTNPQISDLRDLRDIRRAVIEELKLTYR